MSMWHALGHRVLRGASRKAPKHRVKLEVGALEERALLSTMDPDLLTTASVNGAAVTSPLATNASSVTVDFSASDPDEPAGSALTTEFSVNGAAFTTGDNVTLTNQGNYTIQYFSTDASGGVEATKTLSVTIDRTAPTVTITSVSPTSLWPPNGKPVAVTVQGTVNDNLSGVVSPLAVQVQNEPGYQGGFTLPTSPVMVQPTMTNPQGSAPLAGDFTFTVSLQARRAGFDHDGRQYTILVTATDAAGNSATTSTVVTVPHDQGHHNGGGNGGQGPGGQHGHGQGSGHTHGHGQGSGHTHGHGQGGGQTHGHGSNTGHGHGHGNSSGHGHGHGHGHGG